MNILGISGSTHDSSASLILNNEIFMAIEEERLTRIKHATTLKPLSAINVLLEQAKINPKDIDLVSYFIDPILFNKRAVSHVVFGDPLRYLKYPRAYRTGNFIRRGQRYILDLENLLKSVGISCPVEYVQHHLAHASGAFFPSGFNEAMILVVDNMGELDSTTLLYGKGNRLDVIKSQKIPHSLGMFYGAMTQYLGFKPWDEEGKVMALAAYGSPIIPFDEMIYLTPGSFRIKKPFQMIETQNHERCFDNKLIKLLGPARKPGDEIKKYHKDIAASIQYAVEETTKSLVQYMHKITGCTKLCISGGVGLNCKMNGELAKLPFIDGIYVPPAPGDNGTSLGAAVYSLIRRNGLIKTPLHNAGLGRSFNDDQIKQELDKSGILYYKSSNIAKDAAMLLLKEGIIAWYQGRSEFGPRALGNRSILALPQTEQTRDHINKNIKNRELWRPLCPSISAESISKYVENPSDSRFMNIAFNSTRYAREKIPAVVHIDNTMRVQKVYKEESPLFSHILNIIGENTGDPVLLNTSFNCKGEPIVDTPSDALKTFINMPINTLILGDYIVIKNR